MSELNSIEEAIRDIKEGKIVIVVDDADRENEGDMIFAAEKITPEEMGRKSRTLLSEIQALTINYIPLYYMEGRMGEIFRNGGDPKAENEEKRKQTIFV